MKLEVSGWADGASDHLASHLKLHTSHCGGSRAEQSQFGLSGLGAMGSYNALVDRRYGRNLGTADGIELMQAHVEDVLADDPS